MFHGLDVAPCCLQLLVNAKGSFTADSQAAARTALGGSVDDTQLRQALLAAAEAELASKPTSVADDERMLQVGGSWVDGCSTRRESQRVAVCRLPNASCPCCCPAPPPLTLHAIPCRLRT